MAPMDKNIRPTTDRMRETIFNILSHISGGLQGAKILDVFAGTGAMGIEAISRGAATCTFFDKDRKARQLVKKNSTLLKSLDKTTIKNVSAPDFPPSKIAYDIVFLDPPYDLDVISDTINGLKENNYLADQAILIAEYAAEKEPQFPHFLNVMTEKTYGDARFSFLRVMS